MNWVWSGIGFVDRKRLEPLVSQPSRRSWWSRVLAIPGYAAGWLGDHLINILIAVFAIVVTTFMLQPL